MLNACPLSLAAELRLLKSILPPIEELALEPPPKPLMLIAFIDALTSCERAAAHGLMLEAV